MTIAATVQSHRQQGVALITALLIVSLATIAAVAMASTLQLELRRTGNVLHSELAYAYAAGGEDWAIGQLARDAHNSKKANDNLAEDWAKPLGPTGIDGGSITVVAEDLQGRFNLNNLVSASGNASARAQANANMELFKRMLRQQGLDEGIATAVADWLDGDVNARAPGGAEDLDYLQRKPPYRTGNRPMANPSELRLVEGVTADAYAKLAPLVTALPGPTVVNVNTAPPGVLQALFPSLDPQQLQALVQRRQTQPFLSTEQALAYIGAATQNQDNGATQQGGSDPRTGLVGVSSHYFLVHTSVRIGKARSELFSVIRRGDGGRSEIISRSLGTY